MTRVIILEGIECSGKSTAIERIAVQLKNKGFKVAVINKEDSKIDSLLREALQAVDLTNDDKLLLMFLRFLAKRRLILRRVEENFEYVLVDRYDVSMYVFAEMLNNLPLLKSLLVALPEEVHFQKYVFCDIDYEEFCNRWQAFRKTSENEDVNIEWFNRKRDCFNRYYGDLVGKSFRLSRTTSTDDLVRFLCSGMY